RQTSFDTGFSWSTTQRAAISRRSYANRSRRRDRRRVRPGCSRGGEGRSRREDEGGEGLAGEGDRREQVGRHAHLREVRSGERQAPPLGVHREGRFVLGGRRRPQDRQGGEDRTDHQRRRPDRGEGAERGNEQGQDPAARRRSQGGQGEQGLQGGERDAGLEGRASG